MRIPLAQPVSAQRPVAVPWNVLPRRDQIACAPDTTADAAYAVTGISSPRRACPPLCSPRSGRSLALGPSRSGRGRQTGERPNRRRQAEPRISVPSTRASRNWSSLGPAALRLCRSLHLAHNLTARPAGHATETHGRRYRRRRSPHRTSGIRGARGSPRRTRRSTTGKRRPRQGQLRAHEPGRHIRG